MLLGDRMKALEGVEAQRRLDPSLPIILRCDGCHFHTFTVGLNRPFDHRFTKCMMDATIAGMNKLNAVIGYTQSDEITFVILPKPDPIYSGRVHKLCSTTAALVSVAFYRSVLENLPTEYADRIPTFDCRAWNVPSLAEARNAILWRELDAEKNSISMLAQSIFTDRELYKQNSTDKRAMLEKAGKPWDMLPTEFKRGVYFKRVTRVCTIEDVDNLPEKHHARLNPLVEFTRSEVQQVNIHTRLTNVDELF